MRVSIRAWRSAPLRYFPHAASSRPTQGHRQLARRNVLWQHRVGSPWETNRPRGTAPVCLAGQTSPMDLRGRAPRSEKPPRGRLWQIRSRSCLERHSLQYRKLLFILQPLCWRARPSRVCPPKSLKFTVRSVHSLLGGCRAQQRECRTGEAVNYQILKRHHCRAMTIWRSCTCTSSPHAAIPLGNSTPDAAIFYH
jgi:hypothetical protein